ncbi:Hypothetical predicted protein [Lecanosticta acicola]|uniref:Uncharacterized protein n=1 Tax=Lecanosticta acicola TaxID=111012 RepID=A0AAI8W135_9PEZI|nr:Hypothetical predicted protein [Lecanosticta acicola]
MCFYRYHYFGACQHQSCFLTAFCEKALPLGASPPNRECESASEGQAQQSRHEEQEQDGQEQQQDRQEQQQDGQEQQQDGQEQQQDGQEPQQEREEQQQDRQEQQQEPAKAPTGAYDYSLESFPALSTKTPPKPASSLQASSSANKSSVSSTPTSYANVLSLPRQQPRSQHPAPKSEDQGDDMATLGFGRPSFRSLFASGPSKSTVAVNPVHHDTQGNVNVNEQPRSTRSRQTGLRDNTEDSSILPDIGENLQHIAVSTRGNIHAQNVGTDSQSISSHDGGMYSDSLHDNSGRSRVSIEAIESDLRLAQEEVERIKAAQTAVENNAIPQLEPTTSPTARSPTVRSPTVRSPRTLIPQPQRPSAAARLQARHEENERRAKEAASKPPVVEQPPPPPSASEFPALGNTTPSHQQTRNVPSSSSRGRRASYANISAGSKRTGNRAVVSMTPSNSTPTRHPTRSAATTSATSPGAVASPIPEGEPSEDSVVFSPAGRQAGDSSNTIRGPSSPIRQPPRFAQPTKASSIRTSESQRKDSVIPGNKSSPETSPNKTVRTLAQRHQKRSSLPGAWTSSPASATSDTSAAVGSLGVAISPSRHGNTRPVANKDKVKARADAGTETQTIRSYMSPTKATAQRELATLGQENVKQAAPRVQKQPSPIDTTIPGWTRPPPDVYSESAPLSARTVSSHSEYIITERLESPPSAAVSAFLDRTTRLLSQARRSHNMSSSSSLYSAASTHPSSRRSTIGITTVAEVLSVVAKETGLPPNNYIKRRGSHGHLLGPITEKLNRLGLLDRSKSSNLPDNAFRPLTSAAPGVNTADKNMPKTPYKQSDSTTREDYGATSPHLRQARAGTTSNFSQPGLSSGVPAAGHISSSGIASMLGSLSQPRSLRATAQEFRPMAQSTPTHPQRTHPAQQRHGYISNAEWSSLSPDIKQGIFLDRHFRRNNRNSPVHLHDSAQYNLSLPFSQINTDGSFSGQVAAHLESFGQSSGAEAVSEPVPQAGHVLQPEVDPSTNRLQWVVRDGTGNSHPINLGRAAAPSSGSPGTPALSPRSDDTSPRRSPPSPPRGWSIASAASMRGRYGWAGGDGREIKFRGYGPDAERDPNTPVNFSVQNRAGSYGVVGPRMIGGGEDDEDWSAPLAPRSRRQWAEMMGYPKIPCDRVEITSACETSVPLDPKGWGYCWDCDP